MHAFLPPHIPGNCSNPTTRRLSRRARRFLQTRLDGIDRRVAQWTHGAADKADDHRLPAGKFAAAVVCGLEVLEPGFQTGVGGEVDGLVGALAEGGEGDPAVECAGAFFFDDEVGGVCGVAVFGDVEGVGHAVVLGLESDFDDFHGGDDGYGFGYAGGKSGWEKRLETERERWTK